MTGNYTVQLLSKKFAGVQTSRAIGIVSPEGSRRVYGVYHPFYKNKRSLAGAVLKGFVSSAAIFHLPVLFPETAKFLISNSHISGHVGMFLLAALPLVMGASVATTCRSNFKRASFGQCRNFDVEHEIVVDREAAQALMDKMIKRGHIYNILVNNCMQRPRRLFQSLERDVDARIADITPCDIAHG